MKQSLRAGWFVLMFICGTVVLFAADDTTKTRTQPKPHELSSERFLIIAPELFMSELKAYADYKQKQQPTTLVSLESILKEQKQGDDAERVKRYLYQQWTTHQLGYVLLVGDADIFPVRYMVLDRVTPPAFDYSFYPSDLYFADVAKADGSFEDWNQQKEGFHKDYYGEVRGEKNKTDPINYDQVDYIPELAVGRWPVSTVAELKVVMQKSMQYEAEILSEKKPGMRHAAFFMVGGWVDARGMMHQLADKMPRGWHIEKRFYSNNKEQAKTPQPTEAELERLLQQGQGLVFHAGHGNHDCWEHCFFMSRLDRVKNDDRLPVIFSAGCSTAYFATLPPYEAYMDIHGKEHKGTNSGEVFTEPPPAPACYQKGPYNRTGLGEQLLKRNLHGAVAYIGCNTGSQPCGLSLMEGFVLGLSHSRQPRVGSCWAYAMKHYYTNERLAQLKPTDSWYPPSIFFQGMKFMLFGDPTLRIPSPKDAAD